MKLSSFADLESPLLLSTGALQNLLVHCSQLFAVLKDLNDRNSCPGHRPRPVGPLVQKKPSAPVTALLTQPAQGVLLQARKKM